MKTRSENKAMKRGGSALILVIVVTVLLAVIGIMFVMVSRLEGVLSVSITQDRELDEAVNMTTARIEQVLMEDLFDQNMWGDLVDDRGLNEPYDWPGRNNAPNTDVWLAPLEPEKVDAAGSPDPAGGFFRWPSVTNLVRPMTFNQLQFNDLVDSRWDRFLWDSDVTLTEPNQHLATVPEYYPTDVDVFGPADADGDGVLDSVWIQLDGSTCRGREVYAAVRIIDNDAMLNLNTASVDLVSSYPGDWRPISYFEDAGKYLSELNYRPFLRGTDWNYPSCLWRARNRAKQPWLTFEGIDAYHNNAIMHLGDPNYLFVDYEPFGIEDELEIRNRFLLTSLAQARFERQTDTTVLPQRYGLYTTFDFGRGEFGPGWNTHIRARRIPYTAADFDLWEARLDPANFAYQSDNDPQTDRRHLCTFYSFDRPLPVAGYPELNHFNSWVKSIRRSTFIPENGRQVNLGAPLAEDSPEARRRVLQMLFVFRSYYMQRGDDLQTAAGEACQLVANVIDYQDDPNQPAAHPFYSLTNPGGGTLSQSTPGPTRIDYEVIRSLVFELTDPAIDLSADATFDTYFGLGIQPGDVFYGYEKQPFISEIYTSVDNDSGGLQAVGIELVNPYSTPIDLTNWRIRIPQQTGTTTTYQFGTDISTATVIPAASDVHMGHLVISTSTAGVVPVTDPGSETVEQTVNGLNIYIMNADSIDLQRPDDPLNPVNYMTVDRLKRGDIQDLLTDPAGDGPTYHLGKRDDTAWRFASTDSYATSVITGPADSTVTLGDDNNNTSSSQQGYQLPVADGGRLGRWADFQKVLKVGSQAGGSDPNTITDIIASAADESDLRFSLVEDPELTQYICFMQGPDGVVPGRININTASREVIAAAIPPGMADGLPDEILAYRQDRPIQSIAELADPNAFPSVGNFMDRAVGDLTVTNDFEERDWVINRLANIFTVRSDVFTAYILVRVGRDGPQRRMLAIYDRSRVWTPEDRPRLVALHPVPDPR